MPISREQFRSVQYQANEIINSLLRKEARDLARQLEPEVAWASRNDQALAKEMLKLTARLKWVASPILEDSELFSLARNFLLEGIETEALMQIVTAKLSDQFGVGLLGTLNGILSAVRENNQTIGPKQIMVKGETRPVKPTIRHWLIDFLRNTESENPGEMEETAYLFGNPNAQALSEEDKRKLTQVLGFYDMMRLISREAALAEKAMSSPDQQPLVAPLRQKSGDEFHFEGSQTTRNFSNLEEPEKPAAPAPPKLPSWPPSPQDISRLRRPAPPQANQAPAWRPEPNRQFTPPPRPQFQPQPQQRPEFQARPEPPRITPPPAPPSDRSAPSAERWAPTPPPVPPTIRSAPSVPPVRPVARPNFGPTPAPIPPPIPPRPASPHAASPYRETITEEDLSGPQAPKKPTPQINGNVINLKNMNHQ